MSADHTATDTGIAVRVVRLEYYSAVDPRTRAA